MNAVASLLLLVRAAAPMAAKWKAEEKTLDPVAVSDVRKVAGRYVGIDPDYVVALRLDENGTLSGRMTQFGVTSTLRDLRIDAGGLA